MGKGVFWEGTLIYNYLYNSKRNERYVPVLLSERASEADVPSILRGYTPFQLAAFGLEDAHSQYSKLYRLLTKQPGTLRTKVGTLQKLPPLPQEARQTDFTLLIQKAIAESNRQTILAIFGVLRASSVSYIALIVYRFGCFLLDSLISEIPNERLRTFLSGSGFDWHRYFLGRGPYEWFLELFILVLCSRICVHVSGQVQLRLDRAIAGLTALLTLILPMAFPFTAIVFYDNFVIFLILLLAPIVSYYFINAPLEERTTKPKRIQRILSSLPFPEAAIQLYNDLFFLAFVLECAVRPSLLSAIVCIIPGIFFFMMAKSALRSLYVLPDDGGDEDPYQEDLNNEQLLICLIVEAVGVLICIGGILAGAMHTIHDTLRGHFHL